MIQKVRTSLIQSGAVVGNTLGPTSVSSNNIVVGSITGNLIAANAVSGNTIANGSISNVKLSEPNAFEDYFLLGLGS